MTSGKRTKARRAYEERKATLFKPWEPPEVVVPEIIPPFIADDVRFAMHIKNCATHDMLYGNGDIPQILTFYRDGELIARILCSRPNRDEGLEAAQLGMAYWSCDLIVMVSDSHYVDERWWDAKGRKPDPHELQHLCDHEGACDLGLTTDVLAVNAVAKSLLSTLVSVPYHVNKSARQVHWQPEVIAASEDENVAITEGVDRMSLGGDVYNVMRQILGMEPMFEKMHEKAAEAGVSYGEWVAGQTGAPGFTQATEEEFRFQMDMAGLNFLTAAGYQVLFTRRDDEYNARVDAWLTGAGYDQKDGMFRGGAERGSDAIRMLGARYREDSERRWSEIHQREMAVAAKRRAERGE